MYSSALSRYFSHAVITTKPLILGTLPQHLSQYLNVSRIILQFSLPNPLKPGVNSLRPSDAYMRQ